MNSRNNYLLRVYGITQEQYDELLTRQDHVCYICKKPEKTGFRLCVDHNHSTGRIRGLLCRYCNRYIVGRHTDPDLMQRVVDYLRQGTDWYVPKKKKRRRKKRH